jgi:glycosyltransferase involved in cell wall biosynthesis
MSSGDEVRVHSILSNIMKLHRVKVVVFNISPFVEGFELKTVDDVIYITLPRRFYTLVSRITKWNKHYDYNPLMKITHYIDEFLVAYKLQSLLSRARILMIFGTMSLFSFMARCLGARRSLIIYDPLANYAQTLYVVSRKNLLKIIRYGLYLALQKLEIQGADIVLYPSRIDLENAQRMFKPKKAIVIPNPAPVCYESIEEYVKYRSKRTDNDRPYFILLAGGRWRANEEVVKITIEVFNDLPSEKFKLIITGPWQDMEKYVKNPSIELLGVVPREKLKELLAISDYGLSPVFSHSAGTFVKVLAYICAGLRVIASLYSVMGLNTTYYSRVHIVRDKEEFSEKVREVIESHRPIRGEKPQVKLCSELYRDLDDPLSLIIAGSNERP